MEMPRKWDFYNLNVSIESLKVILGALITADEPPTEVDLSANQLNANCFSQEGTIFVARYLSTDPPVEVLDLGCTNTSNLGVEALMIGLEFNTHLRQLRLSNNSWITQEPMQRLYEAHKQRVPDFKLITHDPNVTVTVVETESTEKDSSILFKEKRCK